MCFQYIVTQPIIHIYTIASEMSRGCFFVLKMKMAYNKKLNNHLILILTRNNLIAKHKEMLIEKRQIGNVKSSEKLF